MVIQDILVGYLVTIHMFDALPSSRLDSKQFDCVIGLRNRQILHRFSRLLYNCCDLIELNLKL